MSNAAGATALKETNETGAKPGNTVQGSKKKSAFVVDPTAIHDSVPRVHELILDGKKVSFKFEPGKPLEMDIAAAVKFHSKGFVLTDADGKPLDQSRRPKQPDELEAGEKLVLSADEVVARYDELNMRALLTRVLELPGGEKFAQSEKKPQAAELIDFIKKTRAAMAKANVSKTKDLADDEFTPEFGGDDD